MGKISSEVLYLTKHSSKVRWFITGIKNKLFDLCRVGDGPKRARHKKGNTFVPREGRNSADDTQLTAVSYYVILFTRVRPSNSIWNQKGV
jgi:hypothetical protein